MAQAVHAAFEFSHQHPDITGYWLASSNYIVIVSVPDEAALHTLCCEAIRRGLTTTVVREPDVNDEVTALAIEPGLTAQKLCATMPLALKMVPT